MRFGKKIKYQIENYKRAFSDIFNYSRLPEWLTGRCSRCLMLGALIFCSACYVFQITSASSSGYQMKDLQKNVNILREEINKTNIEAVSYGSLTNLEKRIKELNMNKVNSIVYISAPDVMFAKK
jgi:hypothetical protein